MRLTTADSHYLGQQDTARLDPADDGCFVPIDWRKHGRLPLCLCRPGLSPGKRRLRVDSNCRVSFLRSPICRISRGVKGRLTRRHTYVCTNPELDPFFCKVPRSPSLEAGGKHARRVPMRFSCDKSEKCTTCERGRRTSAPRGAIGSLSRARETTSRQPRHFDQHYELSYSQAGSN